MIINFTFLVSTIQWEDQTSGCPRRGLKFSSIWLSITTTYRSAK